MGCEPGIDLSNSFVGHLPIGGDGLKDGYQFSDDPNRLFDGHYRITITGLIVAGNEGGRGDGVSKSRLEQVPAEAALPRIGFHHLGTVRAFLFSTRSSPPHSLSTATTHGLSDRDGRLAFQATIGWRRCRQRNVEVGLALWAARGFVRNLTLAVRTRLCLAGGERKSEADWPEQDAKAKPEAATRPAVAGHHGGADAAYDPQEYEDFHGSSIL
jgi:hypothetical protein